MALALPKTADTLGRNGKGHRVYLRAEEPKPMNRILTPLLATVLMAGPVFAVDAPAGGPPPVSHTAKPTSTLKVAGTTKTAKKSNKSPHAPTHVARSASSEKPAHPGKRTGVVK